MNSQVEITALAHRGVGIARRDGKVLFVPLTAPGDKVEIRVVRSHRRYDECRVVRVLQPSPHRREPPCPLFGRCGGCQLQHLDNPEQHRWKEVLFREILTHQGGVDEAALGEIRFGNRNLGYRTRMDLHVAWDRKPALGFKALGSDTIVPVESCPVAVPPLQSRLAEVLGILVETRAREVQGAEIACDEEGHGFTLSLSAGTALSRRTRRRLTELAPSVPGLRGLAVSDPLHRAACLLWETETGIRGVRYAVPSRKPAGEVLLEAWPGVFSQVNPEVNRILVSETLSAAEASGPRILDLYAGMGNLTVPLAALARGVVAVEVHPLAVENGRMNAQQEGMENIRWVCSSAGQALKDLLTEGEPFDVAVLDPPRTGALGVLDALCELVPKRILYVSCDPATLARDLRHLQRAGGYVVQHTRPLDMFPQTFHTESLTILHRAAGKTSPAYRSVARPSSEGSLPG